MKVIILAAGQGTRLRPYTNDCPKCMVKLAGKPLLHHQLKVTSKAGIQPDDIALVGGYMKERLDAPGINYFFNERYASTNMVTTLFCAQAFMEPGEDLLISYGDIVYESRILDTLLYTEGEVVIAADQNWKRLWSLRMENPLADAETFIMKGDRVVELGKSPQSYKEVQAQYLGLIRVRGDKVQAFIDYYHQMNTTELYDGKDYKNMYMTSFIQALINSGWKVNAALVNSGWLEVDTASELELYNKMQSSGELKTYFDFE